MGRKMAMWAVRITGILCWPDPIYFFLIWLLIGPLYVLFTFDVWGTFGTADTPSVLTLPTQSSVCHEFLTITHKNGWKSVLWTFSVIISRPCDMKSAPHSRHKIVSHYNEILFIWRMWNDMNILLIIITLQVWC